MRDCKHLDIPPPQQQTPSLRSEPVAFCRLKTDALARIKMASEAAGLLGTVCPPNTECHYYRFDLCEKCPSYTKQKLETSEAKYRREFSRHGAKERK